jgi:hypothetical protein
MQKFKNGIYNSKTVEECIEKAKSLYDGECIRQIHDLKNGKKEIIYWNGDIKCDEFTIQFVPEIIDNSFTKSKDLGFRHQIWKFKRGNIRVVKWNIQPSNFLKEDEAITEGIVYINGQKITVGYCDPQDNKSKLRLKELCQEIHNHTRRLKELKPFKNRHGNKAFNFMFNWKTQTILKDTLYSFVNKSK